MDDYLTKILYITAMQCKYNNYQYVFINDNITYSKNCIQISKNILNRIKNNFYTKEYIDKVVSDHSKYIHELKLLFIYNAEKIIDCVSISHNFINNISTDKINNYDYIKNTNDNIALQNLEIMRKINDDSDNIIYNYDKAINILDNFIKMKN
ncbi:unknown similar to AMEV011 [Choristoneura rosaceana entomopoxvirus 'L']|uniref:N1R/p28-like protein n=1 Tax=Choristoneura rosaceana entomopoxvirus 'L' TaxID=1293539 RepID=A0ABM9QK91_9POXV|nr:unknown similar to AMEV011 [Choristoneura rosaceana entomopoxvirus 'L']CCU55943.1 unknown similar to AMEV011 [Choristoneura rosaceana entomopoxvirus 'L']